MQNSIVPAQTLYALNTDRNERAQRSSTGTKRNQSTERHERSREYKRDNKVDKSLGKNVAKPKAKIDKSHDASRQKQPRIKAENASRTSTSFVNAAKGDSSSVDKSGV